MWGVVLEGGNHRVSEEGERIFGIRKVLNFTENTGDGKMV